MKKQFIQVGCIATAIFLLGAGCDKATDEATSASIQAQAKSGVEQINYTEQKSGGFTVTAEPIKNGTLNVNFTVPEDLSKSAEAYRLLLSKDASPAWPTKGYWYELGKSHTSKLWSGLPVGKKNLRVCAVKNNECTAYSNNLEVEIN